MFKDLKDAVKANFEKLAKEDTLYEVNLDRDKIWEVYLEGFEDPAIKQEHTCNTCKSFLRQYASIAMIKDNKRVTLWDNLPKKVQEEYEKPIKNMRRYINSLPIANIFLTKEKHAGKVETYSEKHEVIFKHFNFTIPEAHRNKNADTLKGNARTTKEVFQRSLEELSLESGEIVLELIEQGSLYRGAEFKHIIEAFVKAKETYSEIPEKLKDNFLWSASSGSPASRVRNTAIGTLLINLSEGMDLTTAVEKYERVVAPVNYKRPKALVTKAMVNRAKETLEELGLIDALDRRFAVESDLTVNNILFKDKVKAKDVFDEVAKETKIDKQKLKKVEEITIKDFMSKVVPKADTIELLIENSHQKNFMSLITSEDNKDHGLFKWPNPFSWSYTGGITDSMKEDVKKAGGDLEGLMRFSLRWNENGDSIVDLDAHSKGPMGHLFYGNRGVKSVAFLDVDMIDPVKTGIENIVYKKVKKGTYKFWVRNYNHKRHTGFDCQLEVDGTVYDFSHKGHSDGDVPIAEVSYDGKDFTVKSKLDPNRSINSKEKWGIKTNQFTEVKTIMISPNHWDKPVGNKHYLFTLDGCVSDEKPRPFFNEFLKNELDEHRKVFEILGSKVKISKNPEQLSGVGFSETKRDELIAKVSGSFNRTLKIKF